MSKGETSGAKGPLQLETARLQLVLQSREQVLSMLKALSPAELAEVSADWLERLHASGEPDPWTHGFLVLRRDTGAVVGKCGFTARPGAQGLVEIAYAIAPEHQGKGYATEAAGALVEYARGTGVVRRVRAHAMPGARASARVLEKNGFRLVGEVTDPADGRVCRFELELGAAGSGSSLRG